MTDFARDPMGLKLMTVSDSFSFSIIIIKGDKHFNGGDFF